MFYSLVIGATVFLALSSGVEADQCAVGSSLIGGNWYCQPVEAIRYSNVGTAGSYKEVIEMKSDGTCKSKTKHFRGPLSPLNEEVSLHFRGPIKLKQLAAYTLSTPVNKNRRDKSSHANMHKQMHRNLKAKAAEKSYQKRQIVTATIDGQVVTWENNWFGSTKTRTDAPTGTPKPDMVTATINGQVISWENNWQGNVKVRSQAPDMVTATIDGQVVTCVNNWFGPGTLTTSTAVAAPTSPLQVDGGNIQKARPDSAAGLPVPQNKDQTSAKEGSQVAPAAKVGTSSSSTLKPPARVSAGELSSVYERIGYYHSASQTLENLVFLGNHGGQGSGVFDYKFGASLAYANRKGTGGATGPQILADTTLPSNAEVIVMLGEDCSDGKCGYTRPGSVAHHGFGGADKVFLMEFSMPKDGTTGFNADMPAIWMLNAQIPRTLQYGNGDCSCWKTGCGEFDIAETLSTGSTFMKSTLHTNTPGGDSDYFLRPLSGTMKLAVIFDASEATAHIQVLPQGYDFPARLTGADVKKMSSDTAASRVSHFHVHSGV